MVVAAAVKLTSRPSSATWLAREWAMRLGEPLLLLHVTWPCPPGEAEGATQLSALAQLQRRSSEATLSSLPRELVWDGGTIITHTLFGRADRALLEYASANPMTLLVVGAPTPVNMAQRFLFKSVTQELICQAPCPVLVAPHGADSAARPSVRRLGRNAVFH